MTDITGSVYLTLADWVELNDWPLRRMMPEALSGLFVTPPEQDDFGNVSFKFLLAEDLSLRIPGIDFISLTMSPAGATELTLTINRSPFKVVLKVPLTIRVDADVLRPLKANTSEADGDAEHFDIPLGSVDMSVDENGDVALNLPSSISIPRCMIGTTGVILTIGKIRWITPSSANKPAQTPAGFTGLYMDDVFVEVPRLPAAANSLRMDDVFLGPGGFSGKVTKPGLNLVWDDNAKEFTGDIAGDLFGFKGGLSSVGLEFKQNALFGCDIKGDVFVPYLDKRIGLILGLDGAGSVTATAGLPTSSPAVPPSPVPTGYLLHLDIANFLTLDVDSLRFDAPAGKPSALEISGRLDIDVPGLVLKPVDLKKLRITKDGKVEIEDGWMNLEDPFSASFHGFGLEITRIGFGSDDGGRRWFGLNGGLKLAKGLPLGASVKGFRVSWDPHASDVPASIQVTLEGIGLELTVPGAFHFAGEVAFFDDTARGKGFAGHIDLDLLALKVSVEADLVVARKNGVSYFYIYLSADIPSGIPVMGAAIYGFQGLVARNMGPDKRADEGWYYGWYKRAPVGVTSFEKWKIETGSWAVGLGTVVGTAPDSGYSMSAKVILIVVGPGPRVIFQGKGNILKPRSSSTAHDQEGAFEALLVLDVPAKTFQANLAASYTVPDLLKLEGSVDVGFSWAKPQPAGFWHVFFGEKTPLERRWRADVFGVFTANAWFQIWRDRLNLGGWIGFGGDWKVGPIHAWLNASIDGEANVNLKPHQFDGMLRLIGEGGVEVFGYGFEISAWALVEAKTPAPRYLGLAIHIAVSIDLWLFEYSYEGDLALSWGDRTPPPTPVTPVLERVAADHMKVDEAKDLVKVGQAGTTTEVPPDVRPVLIFNRPVRDPAEIGAPTNPSWPAADDVPPAKFSYRLAHAALFRNNVVIAAAGQANVQGGTLSILGLPTLSGAVGADVELGGAPGKRYPVTAAGTGSLTVSWSVPADAPPSGVQTYRLTAKPLRAGVQIVSVTPGSLGTVDVTMAADPNVAIGALAGGTLTAAGGVWTIIANNGTSLTLRGPDAPGVGAATVSGPPVAPLGGNWLPVSDEVAPAQTTLMLGTKTPFAWFRHNDSKALPSFEVDDPAYGCGPVVRDEMVCGTFDALMPGPVKSAFHTGLLHGTVTGFVTVVKQPQSGHMALELKTGSVADGAVSFIFDPPVRQVSVWVSMDSKIPPVVPGRGSKPESVPHGTVTAYRGGTKVQSKPFTAATTSVELSGEIDRVTVGDATSVDPRIHKVCFSPEWRCVVFDASVFPKGSTERKSYWGLGLEPVGSMSVEAGELVVRVPTQKAGAANAVCMVHLPKPVTAARVKLGAAATVAAYAGFTKVAEVMGAAGDDVELRPKGWLDRVHIAGQPELRVRRVCYTIGKTAWSDQELADWQASVTRSLDAFYKPEPVLAKGDYRLEAIAGWDDETTSALPIWSTDSYVMKVGYPPGLVGTDTSPDKHYPDGGALSDLSLYVDRTTPAGGGRPHYTGDDVGVFFNVSYLSQMFLLAQAPVTVEVRDANDVDRRVNGVNLWGSDPDLSLDPVETEWMKALHGDGTNGCVAIDPARVPHNEMVVSSGPLLAESQLHSAFLKANGRTLFTFDFVCSRYSSFIEHVGTFEGRCRTVTTTNPGTTQIAAAKTATTAAATALATALTKWTNKRQAAMQSGAGRAAIDAYETARTEVNQARTALGRTYGETFSSVQASYGTPPPGMTPLPPNVEVTRLPNALLLESPEPLHFERVAVTASRSDRVPLTRRIITFSPAELGAPDIGTFSFAGSAWSTDKELRVVDDAVEPRISTSPWNLTIKTRRARRVVLVIRVSQGAFATVTARRIVGPARTFSVTRPADGSPVTVAASFPMPTPSDVDSIQISGSGIALESMTIVEPFIPIPPSGDVRLVDVHLPASSTDDSHSVDLIAFRDVALDGWSVRWVDAVSPADAVPYYTFGTGTVLKQGRVARVFGALSHATTPERVDAYFGGGAVGSPAPNGAVFQLLNESGHVVHELALMQTASYADQPNVLTIPDADGSRALLVNTSGPLPAGHWHIGLSFARDAGPGLPVLSVAGDSSAEAASLYFTIEK